MLFIAWKNLSRERGRFLLSIGGVTFAVLLILVIGALYQGWSVLITKYIESVDADLWVAQKGTGDMSHTFSLLPAGLSGTLENIEGVERVRRFVGRRIAFDFKGNDLTLFIVGFDPASNDGGPVKMLEGRAAPSTREVIIDRSLAKKRGLALGDTLPLETGIDWTVVGISTGGNQALFSYAFVNEDEAERLLKMNGFANYFLVTVRNGASVDVVKQKMNQLPDVQATTRDDFIEVNRNIIKEAFLPIIFVLFVIGFAIGVAIVGLTIYTATIERAKEYGVLKAIGFDSSQLYRIVFLQSFFASVLGYAFGVALAFVLSVVVGNIEPSFITLFRFVDIALVFALTILMALLAAWLPTRRIARIDPAETFRV